VTEQKGKPNPLPLLNRYRLELFHAHCTLVDQLYLRHWLNHLNGQEDQPVVNIGNESPSATDWDCILIDDRPSQQTRICVLNTLLMTRRQANIKIYTPTAKVEAFEQLLKPLRRWVSIEDLNAYQISDSLGWQGYNQLLKTAAFWQRMTAKHVLIFQPDSLLIQPLDLANLDYGYAGSPWNKGRITSCDFPVYDSDLNLAGTTWANLALCQGVPDQTNNGNGGLSIRSPKLMQAICEDHANYSPPEEAEDIFFARHLHGDRYAAKLPSQEALARLFNETSYTDSCGFHGSWYYLDASDQARLYEKHVKHLIGLVLAL